jgi:putative ABC transport system permease protein
LQAILVYGVTLRPLPYPRPEQLVQVWQLNSKGEREQFSDPNFADVSAEARAFAAIAQFNSTTASVVAGQLPLRAGVATVSRDFFDVFQIDPVQGRRFVNEELREGASMAFPLAPRQKSTTRSTITFVRAL